MSDAIVSVIRTIVPLIVGLVVAQLAKAQIDVDEAALSTVIDGVAVGAYYALARALESRFSWAGFLLGSRRQPHYDLAA